MINLVSIRQAKLHLKLDFDETNTEQILDLEYKIQQASEIVFGDLKIIVPEFTSPTEESETYTLWENNPQMIPFKVKALTLLALGDLWEDREGKQSEVRSDAYIRLLRTMRVPTLA